LEEDLLISSAQTPGYVSESNGDYIVVLDSNLTEELLEEGMVREIVSKIQTMRKEAGFEVMDHIAIAVKDNDKVDAIFDRNSAVIMDETLCDTKADLDDGFYSKEWNLNGEKVTLGVKKL